MIGRKVPDAVRAKAGSAKALAWAPVVDDWVVTTADSLLLPDRAPIAWIDVTRAAWDEPVLEVQIGQEILRLVLPDPGNIPQVLNERVKASVVLQHHSLLVGDKGARFVARRQPGTTDVTWRVTFDAGLDPTDPAVRQAADEALAQLRAATGL